MSIICSDLVGKIQEIYPLDLAEAYDNVGLLIGNPGKAISRVLVALDITGEVVREATDLGADMIISHHPVIFRPVKKILSCDPLGALISDIIRSDINVYALHTNFDNASGGMNDIIVKLLELKDIEPLGNNHNSRLYKLVVFVPKTHQDLVRKAILDAGAGHIGNYSHCSFNLEGTGTFRPLEGSSPFIGSEGRDERVEETRVETIVDESRFKRVVSKMKEAHPYEEPAYDIYPLENIISGGTGRIGSLREKLTLGELCAVLKDRLQVPHLSVGGSLDRKITRVAVVGGAGSDFVSDSIAKGADVLVTGDIKHHEAMDSVAAGLSVIDAGHYFTEAAALPYMCSFISSISQIECIATRCDTNQLKRI